MANKTERIAAVIRKNIADIIQFELHNPKLGFVTIPEVKVSKDISYAKVYVSFIKPEEVKEGMETLEHSKGFIRSSLAKKMDTRRIPSLIFVLDEGFQREEKISELLEKSKK
ncbi:MAG: 30S ribosome-binding factor RbfA [Bacilli bacterium]|jgi:ribosome-binding factor A|nr:30S ribosome-binding factor RbfA [Bacilli bacterium]MDD3068994.1 30S ribosome-binding factor RbfA [Bacilli bacterium]MDD3841725.1 30S ribosome-binding factor RbfA [Bacilli bacterium]HKM10575.1 30S ribosome-binding factor RbfA [Bacilli bacterium]